LIGIGIISVYNRIIAGLMLTLASWKYA